MNSLKKINLNIVLIVILDALFYFIAGYLFILWQQRIKLAEPSVPPLPELAALGFESAQQVLAQAKAYLYFIIFSLILLLLSIIFLASILKCIIWAKTTSTKITFNLISRFLGLNLIWMVFWFSAMILVVLVANKNSLMIFAYAVLIPAVYLTNNLYTIFMKKQKISAIKEALKLCIAKAHLFALPYALIFALLFVLSRLLEFAKFQYSFIIAPLLILVYAAFVRYYASTLAFEIQKIK